MAFIAVAALALVAAQLGLARRALEITLEKLPNKPVAYTKYTAAKNSPAHHLGVASAATKFNMAELFKDGIDALMTANGAGSFADANVLNQIWRDAEIAGRHAYVTPEVGKEL